LSIDNGGYLNVGALRIEIKALRMVGLLGAVPFEEVEIKNRAPNRNQRMPWAAINYFFLDILSGFQMMGKAKLE
jgi:hypothetical protein